MAATHPEKKPVCQGDRRRDGRVLNLPRKETVDRSILDLDGVRGCSKKKTWGVGQGS